ncbi:MAG: DoxX family protein [Thermodesulfobacteriota bacterium]
MKNLNFLTSRYEINKDAGLLVIRVVIGLSLMVFHGYSKIKGGPEVWTEVGNDIGVLGIKFFPVFWGFMAGFAEFFCSFFLILGVLFRPATILLSFTMLVAVIVHLNLPPESPAAGWSGASHALELLAVYVGLFFTGPGKYKL